MLMYRDAELRPDLFLWNGAIAKDRLEKWLGESNSTIPEDLFAFWLRTGGGDIFESETILCPFADPAMGDDIDCVNRIHYRRGLSPEHMIFHAGLGLSAVRLTDERYVVLSDSDYREVKNFRSFEEWYTGWVRNEYAGRYGLPEW